MHNDQQRERTQSYVGLANRTYGLFVETFANANHRMLDFAKSVYDIASRPYTSSALEHTVRENVDRAGQIVELSVEALQQNGAEGAKFAKAAAEQAGAWQEQSMETARGMMRTGVSNMTFVKDATDQQLARAAARFEEMRAQVRSN